MAKGRDSEHSNWWIYASHYHYKLPTWTAMFWVTGKNKAKNFT